MRSAARQWDPRGWSLARQFLALQVAVVTVVVLGGIAAAWFAARDDSRADAARQSLSVAQSVAATPLVREAATSADPSTVLQPYAERVRTATGTDFVVVMDTTGRRWTHPDPAQIGGQFLGHIDAALDGRALTETFTGTLGPSVRAVVPVLGDGGDVTALVAVGVTQTSLAEGLRERVWWLLAAGGAALLAAAGGAWLVSRRVRRQTHDMAPAQLTQMYEYYDAVLHAVREGLLILDTHAGVQLANDEAIRLMGLDPDFPRGTPVDELGLPAALGTALADGVPRADEMHLARDRVLVVNQAEARWRGRPLGTVVTLRDHTDLRALSGELDTTRSLAESLKSQAHEAANRLHTVVSLIELDRTQAALDFATAQLSAAQRLTDRVVEGVGEPVLAALLLGKAAQAHERGVELQVSEETDLPEGLLSADDLVTVVGNLLDNALDAAVAGTPPHRVELLVRYEDAPETQPAPQLPDDPGPGALVVDARPDPDRRLAAHVRVQVRDTGPGLDPAAAGRAFERGWSTKPGGGIGGRGLGLALVGQVVQRHAGTVAVSGDAGAVFTARLPVDADGAGAEAGSASPAGERVGTGQPS